MARSPIETRPIVQLRGTNRRDVEDWIVVEEPLEIRVQGEPLAVIMRTPGHDIELAAGFALTEGIVPGADAIGTIRHCETEGPSQHNVVDIQLAPGVEFDAERLRRTLMASAACGLCGRASLEALATRAQPVAAGPMIDRRVLATLPERLRASQESFGRTGALHAAALFDRSGEIIACREDVGRHNAVDKAIGNRLIAASGIDADILMVSGRTSFEILQKSAVAGIPVVGAISGPTTLAIDTARAFNITLINFLRGDGLNIATGEERVVGT